jgi:GTPase
MLFMKQNAVLVGIQLPKMTIDELEDSLLELSRLVTTLGFNVVGKVTQKRDSEKSPTVLGEGKLVELAQWTGGTGKIAPSFEKKKSKAAIRRESAELGEKESIANDGPKKPKDKAQIVIVDNDLSPSQIRNLEGAVGVTVLDRTGVIIEIFSRHAKTRAARLQVEIAKLNYVAPRIREASPGGEDRKAGGIGAKGTGESSAELDKRRIRDRIKELKTELESISNEHKVRRARRQQEATVALVGYTNAGKSSLMRAMTGSEVLIADQLFATLDTTIRPLHPETRPKILVSDTVGFIKKLPHDLVASFKSTLDEATNASLLLFVVDSADAAFRSQLEVTRKVLKEVGAGEVPSVLVLNKIDLLTSEELTTLRKEFPEAIFISTRSTEDLKLLREKIMTFFETDMVDADVFVSYKAEGVIGEIRSRVRVLSEAYTDEGVKFRVRGTPEDLSTINRKLKTEL